MTDINLFELGGKSIRRTVEALEDSYCFTEQALTNTFPVSVALANDHFFSRSHAENIQQQAVQALRHYDAEEAAHQLRREIYFCSLFPSEARSPTELSAGAGLVLLDHGQNADAVRTILDIPKSPVETPPISKGLCTLTSYVRAMSNP